jgi:hypothetical protein
MQSTEYLEIIKIKEPSVNQNDKSNNALLLSSLILFWAYTISSAFWYECQTNGLSDNAPIQSGPKISYPTVNLQTANRWKFG